MYVSLHSIDVRLDYLSMEHLTTFKSHCNALEPMDLNLWKSKLMWYMEFSESGVHGVHNVRSSCMCRYWSTP